MAKTQLNSPLHASKWGPKWVKSVEFGWEKWRRWCGKPFGIISEHKKTRQNSLFWPPYTRRPSHRPSCVVNSGSEIGLYLVLVDTSEAWTASKNTFYLRIYSKNIANSMWELNFYNPSYVETFSRDIRGFCLGLQPKRAIFGPKIHHCAKYTTRSSEKPCGRHSWDPEGLSLMAN